MSRQVKERLKKEVAEMKTQFPGFRPGLVVLQVILDLLLIILVHKIHLVVIASFIISSLLIF